MVQVQDSKMILLGYSRLLEYPSQDLDETAKGLSSTLSKSNPEIEEEFNPFLGYIEDHTLSRMEEIYSTNFDISPTCYIYAGHQIFGEGFKRSEFIIGLKAKFREFNFDWGNELPDHFAILVKFLAEIELFEDTAMDMINDCLMPALSKMLKGLRRKDNQEQNPYWHVLKSLESYLIYCVEEFKQKEEAQ
ncbi:MAG: hypothetical protein OEY59_01145 [Deltaproteobacteria bacterium]|nr:hypothetical protein [Deltaproteobacteria bacterium]